MFEFLAGLFVGAIIGGVLGFAAFCIVAVGGRYEE